MTLIDIQSLCLSFTQSSGRVDPVLRNVCFSVAAGESFGLVGESGSGKTTVLRCLASQYTHWSGRMRIGARELGHRLERAHCKDVQMVFQDPYGSLHPRHTVFTALAEPLRVHRMDRVSERVDAVLTKVGLPEAFRNRYPHQLSGGQRQRVAIARALIMEPRILLLDEPTSALDVSVQAEILNLLQSLRASDGLTYLLVTHDLGVVAHLCDRIAVMQAGQIVETLATDALCRGDAHHSYTRLLLDASRERPTPIPEHAPQTALA